MNEYLYSLINPIGIRGAGVNYIALAIIPVWPILHDRELPAPRPRPSSSLGLGPWSRALGSRGPSPTHVGSVI